MGRGQSGGERFSPSTLLRNLGDPRRRISRTCVREKEQNNDKNTFSFNFNPQFFFFFFFYSYTHFDGKEGRRRIDKIKLVTLLKKEENWRPETGPVRFANEGQIFEQRFFFLLFYSRRVIYRGRQRRQKFASTAKGDQPFEGSTFLFFFLFLVFFSRHRTAGFKARIIDSSKRKIRILVKKITRVFWGILSS